MIFFHHAVPIYDFHDILVIFSVINISITRNTYLAITLAKFGVVTAVKLSPVGRGYELSIINDLLYDKNIFLPSGKKLGSLEGK